MKKLILIVSNDNRQIQDRIIELAKEAVPILAREGVIALDAAINEAQIRPLLATGDIITEAEFLDLADNARSMSAASLSFVPVFERMLSNKTEAQLTSEDIDFMMKMVIGIKMTTKTMLTAIMDYSHVVSNTTIEDLNEISLAVNMMLGKMKPLDYKYNQKRYVVEAKLRQALTGMNFDPESPPSEEEMQKLMTTLKELADDVDLDLDDIVDPPVSNDSDSWLEGLKQSIGARSMNAGEEQRIKGDSDETNTD